jgi:hypothetical protein
MPVEEGRFVFGLLEARGERQAVIREVQPLAVSQDVLEVRIEVEEPASVHERGTGVQFPLRHRAGTVSALTAGLELGAQPLVQILRNVLQKQRDARRGLLKGLDAAAYLCAATPVGNGLFPIGQFL